MNWGLNPPNPPTIQSLGEVIVTLGLFRSEIVSWLCMLQHLYKGTQPSNSTAGTYLDTPKTVSTDAT